MTRRGALRLSGGRPPQSRNKHMAPEGGPAPGFPMLLTHFNLCVVVHSLHPPTWATWHRSRVCGLKPNERPGGRPTESPTVKLTPPPPLNAPVTGNSEPGPAGGSRPLSLRAFAL